MKTEAYNFELKRQWSDEVLKTVVAFLNSDEGGIIYVGVNDDGTVLGVPDVDGVQLKISNQIKDSISPRCISHIKIQIDVLSEKDVINIQVFGGLLKPYFITKYGMSPRGCFFRLGASTHAMSQDSIDDLYSKRVRNTIREIACGERMLTFEQLKIYYNEKGKTLNEQFESILKFRTSKGDYNILAYLMSDSNSNPIKFAKYNGNNRVDLIESADFGKQSLIKSTKLILEKLEIENKIFSTITPIERENVNVWNAIAIREAVINAIVHNDYTRSASPKIEIFDDRIEISSGGGLPQGINQIEFFQGFSVPRNPEIVRVFSDLSLVEQLGSGISRILEFYPKESIIISENTIRVTFPKAIPEIVKSFSFNYDLLFKRIQEVLESNNMEYVKPTEAQLNRYLELTKLISLDQIKILKYSFSPKSNRELQEDCLLLKKHSDNYKRVIEPLVQEGLLSRTIPGIPSSPKQKYFTSEKGKIFLYIIENESSSPSND
ncbi:RNA-binding domain-containing protein [Aquirufa regiilacus]